MILTASLLTLLSPALAQDSDPDSPGLEPLQRTTFAGAALVVNDTMVTLETIDAELARRLEETPASTDAERRILWNEVLRESLRTALWTQAGEDLGIDPNLLAGPVESRVERMYRTRADRLALADTLDGPATSTFETQLSPSHNSREQGGRDAMRLIAEEDLYRELWVGSTLGTTPGPTGRMSRDRYIRPGELNGIYKRELALLPDDVELQYLVILSAAAGGEAEAFEFAAGLREEVLEGRDLAEVVDAYGALLRSEGGVAPPTPADALPALELRAWVRSAVPGTLSPVLPFRSAEPPGEIKGWQVVRLLSRESPSTPLPFTSPPLQRSLLRRLGEIRDRDALEVSDIRLQDSAYLWSFLEAPTPAAPTPAGSGPARPADPADPAAGAPEPSSATP